MLLPMSEIMMQFAFHSVWLGPGAKSGMQTMMKSPSLARRDPLFEKDHSMLFTWFVHLCNDNLFHMVCAFVQFPWQFVSHGLCNCAIFRYQFDVLHMVCAILQFPYVVGCWTLGEEMGMCNRMSEQVYGLKSMWDPIICPHPQHPQPPPF